MKRLILSAFIIASFFSGCTTTANNIADYPDSLPRELTAHEKQLIKADESFSYDIFRRISADEQNKNVFISPLSISMALGMVLNGTAGSTQDNMKQTLYMHDMDIQQIDKSYQSLIKLLVDLDPKVQIMIANSLWNDEDFAMKDAFVQVCKNYFNAEARELDFSDPESVNIINDWVNDHTNGLIHKIIAGNISPEMVMYLINAIYFKGDWLHRFDKDKTKKEDFHLGDGSTVKTNMMQQEGSNSAYLANKTILVDLPYGDSLYTMTLMMPPAEDMSIDEFIQQQLTAPNVSMWLKQLHSSNFTLYLPKFELKYEKKLNDILEYMGMKVAFDPNKADFSKINSDKQLFISEMRHKSVLKVDEEGTEAAAVTSVRISTTSVSPGSPAIISFNRPFVLMIRERISGTILFMGVMRNPVQSN